MELKYADFGVNFLGNLCIAFSSYEKTYELPMNYLKFPHIALCRTKLNSR